MGSASQFDHCSIIQLGELHRSLQIHTFGQQMLRDLRFISKADASSASSEIRG
jgi:hypothetical protein